MLGEEVQTKGKLMNSVQGGEIQLTDQNDTLFRKDDFDLVEFFLGPTNHLFKRKVCLSVCPLVNRLVGRSVGWSVTPSHFLQYHSASEHRMAGIGSC